MKIILDSNILFSALIKDSITRRVILEYEGEFLFPLIIFEELEEHKEEIKRKSKLHSSDFDELLILLLKKVYFVSDLILHKQKEEAIELVKDIDLDDVLFVACALAYDDSIIWSDDKKLKNIEKIQVLNTQEMLKMLKYKT